MPDPINWAQPLEPEPLSITCHGGNIGRWFWDSQTTIGQDIIPGRVRFLATVADHRAFVLS